ncbi:MAG: hypothetical protein C0483_18000, partial [Pirellula sp.]|nr:hypothetical protein [Pirellula sp.]
MHNDVIKSADPNRRRLFTRAGVSVREWAQFILRSVAEFCSVWRYVAYDYSREIWNRLLDVRTVRLTKRGHYRRNHGRQLGVECLEDRAVLTVSAVLNVTTLTVTVDSSVGNSTAFIRYDDAASAYRVRDASGDIASFAAASTTAITVNGTALANESVVFEGAGALQNFDLTGAVNVSSTIENATASRNLSFGSVVIGANVSTVVNNAIVAKTGGSITIDSGTVTLAASLTSNSVDVNVRATTAGLTVNQAIAANSGTVRLISAGNIAQGPNGVITAAALSAVNTSLAAGNIDLTTSTTANNVGTFAARNDFGGGSIKYRDADGFSVGSLATSGGFTGSTGVVTADNLTVGASSGSITLQSGATAAGGLSIDQQIRTGAVNAANPDNRGDVRLSARGSVFQNETTGLITTDRLGVEVRSTAAVGSTITLQGSNSARFFSAENHVAGTGVSAYIAYVDADDLTIDSVSLDGTLFAGTTGVKTEGGDGTQFSADVFLKAGATAAGFLNVDQAITAGVATPLTRGNVHLSARGDITQLATGVITANTLGAEVMSTANAGSVINLAAVANSVNSFSAANNAAATSSADGYIKYRDADVLTISALGGVIIGSMPIFNGTSGLTTASNGAGVAGNVTIVAGG